MNPLHHLDQVASALASDTRIFLARLRGCRIAGKCRIGAGVRLERNWCNGGRGTLTLEEECLVDRYSILQTWGGGIRLGKMTFVGPHCVLYGHGTIEVGEGCLISMHCRILSSNHAVPAAGIPIRSQPDIPLPTIIGRDVWLGAGVTVLGGVTIGEGCVIGAGAVVAKDMAPGSIAAGVPAKVFSRR